MMTQSSPSSPTSDNGANGGESPLEVLSRAATAVILQSAHPQPTVPPPSYDEAQRQLQQHRQRTINGNWDPSENRELLEVAMKAMVNMRSKPEMDSLVCSSSLDNMEPLDMSSKSKSSDEGRSIGSKHRGQPPSYYQAIQNPCYIKRPAPPYPLDAPPFARVDDGGRLLLKTSVSDKEKEGVSSTTGDGETMCDPVIDEHFRRSLGRDYRSVFAGRGDDADDAVVSTNREVPDSAAETDAESPAPLSVDDHFAKALGDTWLKLQRGEKQNKKKSGDKNTTSYE